jgi:hypothetical protein
MKVACAALLVCVVGCGSDSGNDAGNGGTGGSGTGGSGTGGSGTGGAGTGGSGTGGSGTGGSASGYTVLIEGDWTLPSGDEDYRCVRKTVAEDSWVSAFRPKLPTGTHHTVLTLEPTASEPDGITPCDAGTNGPHMIYGSGVGTTEFVMPEGVAVPIPAGAQLVLNLHLFNVNQGSLSGTSGIEVKLEPQSAVVHEAQVTLAGKMDGLVAQPGTSTDTGVCTLENDTTVFAVLPHMHKLGSHLKADTAPISGSPAILLDVDYTFDDQQYFPMNPEVSLVAGDKINVACTYENPKAQPVYYGDSSNDEMCFAAIFEYPARQRVSYYCTN